MIEPQEDLWMKHGGPAFPCGDGFDRTYKGMSLRDYFAAKAMCARISCLKVPYEALGSDYFAKFAYELADAMLKARAEQ